MTQAELQDLVNQANQEFGWGANFFDIEKFAKLVAAKAIAELESQERNFCPRCGKRTNDIHTCTPPQENI